MNCRSESEPAVLSGSLPLLSNQQMRAIHAASLEVLWERGVRITHARARTLLADAGAALDRAGDMVRLPPELVERCLKRTPRRFVLAGRGEPPRPLTVGGGAGPLARVLLGAPDIIDPDSGRQRPGTLEDVHRWVRLVDRLDHIHICSAMFPQDVAPQVREAVMVKAMLEHTVKPVMLVPDDPRQFAAVIDMAIAVRGGKQELAEHPLVYSMAAATSPGILPDTGVEIILQSADHGIPVALNSSPIMGATCPVTPAGGVTQTNLEILAQITVAQTARPGTPVVHRGNPITLDMATGSPVAASVECMLAEAALVQLVNTLYGIPADNFGMHTDAAVADGQSQMERTLNTLLSALAGVSILGGAGQMAHGNALDPVQIVMDDQLMALVARLWDGVAVDRDTIAVDLLKEIGPGNDFLAADHTLTHFRSAHARPLCLNRLSEAAWRDAGGVEMRQAARRRMAALLAEPEGDPLETAVQRELDEILARLSCGANSR